jgi:hypothetical protein
MRFPKVGMIGMAILGATGLAGAHLASGSLKLNSKTAAGGESFAAGASLAVGWQVSVSHSFPINIDISADGGTTWTSAKSGLSDASGAGSSNVTLPAQPTTHAKIRVCQGSATDCANIKVSQPSTAPYTLVSSEFTITGASAIISATKPDFALGFEPGSGKFAAAFDLVRAEKVVLQVVDFRGRVQATLLEGSLAAGAHKMSLALPPELASSSALIFRLKLGETVRTQSFTRP